MRTLLFLFFLPVKLIAQDMAGVWTGFIQTSGNTLPYELVISGNHDKLTGFSLTVFTIDGVENVGIKSMKVRKRKESIYIEDDDLIYNNYSTKSRRVVLFGNLSLSAENSIVILSGTFFTRSVDRSSFKGTIRLEKKPDFSQTRIIPKLDDLDIKKTLSFTRPESNDNNKEVATVPVAIKENPLVTQSVKKEKKEAPVFKSETRKEEQINKITKNDIAAKDSLNKAENKSQPIAVARAASEIGTRKTEILQSFFFESDSLVLSLYDNGEIDGDTVSVVLNDKIIIAKKRLSVTAINTTIYLPPGSGDSLKLVMYAENLGQIPPNTGLLIIQDKNERHEIRFEGDLQKNSGVILRRKR